MAFKKEENPWKMDGSLAEQVHRDVTHGFNLPWPHKPMKVSGVAGAKGKAPAKSGKPAHAARPARAGKSSTRASKKNPFAGSW